MTKRHNVFICWMLISLEVLCLMCLCNLYRFVCDDPKLYFNDFYVSSLDFFISKKCLIKQSVFDKVNSTSKVRSCLRDLTGRRMSLGHFCLSIGLLRMWSWHKLDSKEKYKYRYPVRFLKRYEIWGTGYYIQLRYKSSFLSSCLSHIMILF